MKWLPRDNAKPLHPNQKLCSIMFPQNHLKRGFVIDFTEKFRQIADIPSIWRKFHQPWCNLRNCGKVRNLLSPNFFFCQINSSDIFSKCVAFTKFLPKKRESKFSYSVWHLVMQIYEKIMLHSEPVFSKMAKPVNKKNFCTLGSM